MIDRCRSRWGAVPDIFVANAGIGLPGTILTSEPSRWRDLFDLNVIGVMHQLRAAARAIMEHGEPGKPRDIIVIGSAIARNVSPFNSVYGSSKAAVASFTEALRRELGPHLIRVTLVEPGTVKSEFQAASGYDPEWFARYADEIGPVLEPGDIADLVLFIASRPPHVHLNDVMIRPTRQAYP